MRRTVAKVIGGLLLVIVVIAAMLLIALVRQGHRTPAGTPTYVALGSSYAAGAGLWPRQPDSPWLCARTVNGYPQQVARRLGTGVVDMTCGGAVTANLLDGGQFFQGPQIRVIDRRTRLVTITAGGNDVSLVGDLSMFAQVRQSGVRGWLARRMWGGAARSRDFPALHARLVALLRAVHARAPRATIVVATYPAILPPTGTCPQLQISAVEADLMRPVESRLAATTAAAAAEGGALTVDMHAIGAAHHACSREPWVHGWSAFGDAPFLPTLAGARATAAAIAIALRRSPAGVAAVGEHDAAGHQAGCVRGEEQHDRGDLLR